MKSLVSALALVAFIGAATVPVAAHAADGTTTTHHKAAKKKVHKASHKKTAKPAATTQG